MARSVFRDRRDAGRVLSKPLGRYRDSDVVVPALPRGGAPVAYEVARALDAPLDVLVVRKLGAPANLEPAFGAIARPVGMCSSPVTTCCARRMSVRM